MNLYKKCRPLIILWKSLVIIIAKKLKWKHANLILKKKSTKYIQMYVKCMYVKLYKKFQDNAAV